jgi:hypothetical protein
MKKPGDQTSKDPQPYEKPRLRSFPLATGDVLAKDSKIASHRSGHQGTDSASGERIDLKP